MIDSHLKPPVTVARGFAGLTMGGSNKSGGTYQVDNLTPNPLDNSVDSSCVARWSEKTSWFGFGDTTSERSLEVQDKDASPDLRAALKSEAGQTQLSVQNGAGSRSTELLFDLGSVQGGEIADQMAAARGGRVEVRFEQKGDSQQATVTVGDQSFNFAR